MDQTETGQSGLARLSGVHQPSISQFLAGKIDFSDEQLDRLLSCMGFRLEVVRRAITPELTRSEWRSWKMHRRLATHLTSSTLAEWQPAIYQNLERLRSAVHGEPHKRNLGRWEQLATNGDVVGLRRVLTGLDRDAIEIREVTPMAGLLSDAERLEALGSSV